ncbi:MAG: hypothetical protein ABFD44_12575 [Anaerolineaceae bacterium]
MDYGEILGKAWKIIWKYKILWIFGILAGGVGGGGGGGGGSSSRTSTWGENPWDSFSNGTFPFPEIEKWGNQVGRWFDQLPAWAWVIFAVAMLVLIAIVVTLNVIGTGGLIVGANRADEDAPKLTFGELWTGSLPYFWRLFWLRLIFGLGILLVVMALVLPAVLVGMSSQTGMLFLCLIMPLICLLVPLSWIISLLIEQGSNAIVIENLGVGKAISRAWNLIWSNFWRLLVMALILWLGSLLVGLVLAAPLIALLVPVVIGTTVGNGQALRTGIILTVALICLYMPILLVLGGILKSYISSAWTLTFRRLTGRLAGAPKAPDAPQMVDAPSETVPLP